MSQALWFQHGTRDATSALSADMKDKPKLSAKTLSSNSPIDRARKLADASPPLVADLYLAHVQACAARRNGEVKPRRRRKPAAR
ncbi:MAG: hypothetical protein AB7F09_10790 [Parvibaculaceae bacterium]